MARSHFFAASFSCSMLVNLLLILKSSCAQPINGLTRCPTGSTYCGLDECTPPGGKCLDGSCFSKTRSTIARVRASSACVAGSCPQGSFCHVHSQQCHPETCAMRQALWCPQDDGQLQKVACAVTLPQAHCFASSSGRFTCNVSGRMLAATCGGRAVAALAAADAGEQQQQMPSQHMDAIRGFAIPSSRHRSLLSALSSCLSSIWPSWAHRSSSSSSRPSPPARWSRHRRALQQQGNVLNMFPRDFVDINTMDFDPNRPIGAGLRGEFVDGFLSSLLQDSQATQQIESRFIGPSYGGPVPVASIKPVVNPSGNLVQLGSNPGGMFARMGPGGAVLGSYGGGFAGPFNSRTGTYGLGGSYGTAAPYFGRARGTAVFAVQNATYWQSIGYPTISYPCPQGVPIGTQISVGIPCGVAMVSMPAEDLPTEGGLPAAPLLTPGPAGATPVAGTTPGPTPVTPVPPTTPPVTPPPSPSPPPAMPFNVWHAHEDLTLERGQAQLTAEALPPPPGAGAAAALDAPASAATSVAAAPPALLLAPAPGPAAAAFADKQALTESLLAAMAIMGN